MAKHPDYPKACGLCNQCLGEQYRYCTHPQQIDKSDGVAERSPLSKIRLDLLPLAPLVEVGHVFTFGAQRYGDRNWEFGFSWMRCYGAALRHLWKWATGEDFDDESGCHHLAHAIVNCMFLLEYYRTRKEFDDRPKYDEETIKDLFKPIKRKTDAPK